MSVVFVDLVDFTAFSETLDPEEVRSIQSRYFEVARSVVATYGGTLEKFIGDAVMAVWGAPTAHDDDQARAVRAALAVVEGVRRIPTAAGRSLQARGAVTTGEAAVTVGAVGQGLVTGDLVNAAARLQGEAPAGGVLVDEPTRRLAAEAAGFEPVGALTVKGRLAPLVAHRAVLRTAAWPGRQRGSHSGPFVGRRRELDELIGLFDTVERERRSRIVSITGIAGIGKSRLAWELTEYLDTRPELVLWHAGRAPAYGEGVTFAAVAEMVRRRLRIPEGSDHEVARRHLATALPDFVRGEDERRWMEPRLAVLLGGDAVATFDRSELFAAWRRFFERVSETAPAVLLFEDLQWADSSLLDFVEHLALWTREHPILTIATARPELLERRPSWGTGLNRFTSLHLERLPDAAMAELLSGHAPSLAPSAVAEICAHAGGVPLYAVEVLRMLAAQEAGPSGGDGPSPEPAAGRTGLPIRVPDSLHGVIAARIDAVPADERRLLMAAAVLGRRFRTEALVAIADGEAEAVERAVEGLMRLELLRRDEEPGSPAEGELSFVQDLVREVAYHTLSREERRTLHLAAARHGESLPDDDQAEPLAAHLLAAHRLAPEHRDAPRIARRAVAALRRAARHALRLHVPDQAVDHLEQALGLTIELAQRAVVLDEAAGAARAAGRLDLAEAHLRELVSNRRDAKDATEAARARARLASVLLLAQHNDSALAELESALRAMRDFGRYPGGVELASQLARARMLIGDNHGALEWADRALKAADDLGLETTGLDLLVTRGAALVRLGREADGLADLRRAIAAAAEASALHVELRARTNLAWLIVTDDPAEAMATAREAYGLATTMGVRDWAVQVAVTGSAVAFTTGDWAWVLDTAAELESEGIADAQRIDLAAIVSTIRALRGSPPSDGLLDEMAAIAATTDPQLLAAVHYAQGWVAFASGRFADAAALAVRAAQASFGAERLHHWALAARSALWMADREAAAEAIGSLEALGIRGRAAEATLLTLRCGLGALEGRDVAADYREAAEAWRLLDVPAQLGFCLLDSSRLLARPPSDEAVAILGELGAQSLFALLGDALAPPAPTTAD